MRFTARKFSLAAAADRMPFLLSARMLFPSASVTTHVQPSSTGSRAADEREHRRNLERRLQAQLRDGSRSKDVKRLGDPLVKHLLRVAGNPSYSYEPTSCERKPYDAILRCTFKNQYSPGICRKRRSIASCVRIFPRETRQSIIVTGNTLICEVMGRFPCKRLAVRRQGLAALQSLFGRQNPSSSARRMEVSALMHKAADEHDHQLRESSVLESASPLTLDVETHYVSNRILRKVAGFHSYDDGCIAEMRMPEPSADLGNIRLLLGLGHLPPAFGPAVTTSTSAAASSASGPIECGAIGTLLRTAAALQWQGAWVLPSCPDVFSPLAIRASQGALFWLPYRRGRLEELVQFCRANDLAICVPHPQGIPVTATEIFEHQKRGVCLLLDSSLAGFLHDDAALIEPRKSNHVVSDVNQPKSSSSRRSAVKICRFEPDVCLSLSGIAPDSSMQRLHPISVASLLLYHVKQMHFPSVRGSPFVFSYRQGL